ncbi:MAG: CAP domain-containing protein [Rubellimicrobium sp.]|nr:CAP domain-containing protein [Rubellimicrobium sp.]
MMTIVAAAATAALLAGCDETMMTQEPASMVTRAPATMVVDPGFEAQLNAFRAQNGLQPATPNAQLAAAAQLHAEDMQRQGYFDHVSRDGRTYTQRLAAQGYRSCWPTENLAWGQRSAAQAVVEWAGSPGHRRNMMLQGRVEYGLGQAGNIYVLELARVC